MIYRLTDLVISSIASLLCSPDAIAVDQEQLKGTEAKISCTVNGLTKALDEVKWTDSDGTQITQSFFIENGDLIGNTQTTVLTVPAVLNTQDNTFSCLITSNEHTKVDDSTSVSLKVFSKYIMSRFSRHHGGDADSNILILDSTF